MSAKTKRITNKLCELAGVSRQAYYKWLNRTESARDRMNKLIEDKVKFYFKEHNGCLGTRQLALYLNHDIEVSEIIGRKRMTRVMRDLNLTCRIRQKKQDRITRKEQEIRANILNQQFDVTAPNQAWLTDFTELRYGVHGENKIRLGAVLDLYGRQVLSYVLSPTETTEAAIQCFQRAFQAEGTVTPLIHTDRGSAYTAKNFNFYLENHHIKHSMSRPGTPYDNAPIERWWNDFKLNWVDGHEMPTTLSGLQELVESGIKYFNEKVRSEKRNGQTPVEYRNQAIS